MRDDDDALMERCRAGDADAFAALMHRWEAPVDRVLRRLAPRGADHDGLRQEVFLRVLTAGRRYRASGRFSSWLFRIVVNLARDAQRRRRPLPLGDRQPVDGNGSPPRQTARDEQTVLVEQALGTLPDELREILVLKHYGGLSFTRIARVLRAPPSTIKSRAQAALRQLHAELRKRGMVGDETDEL